MKKVTGKLIIGLCALLMMAVTASPASAAVALNFNPSVSTVGIGSDFDVDVFVFGLDKTDLAAYVLDIGFNDDVLDLQDVTFGPDLGNPLDSVADFTPGIGNVNVAETSLLFDFSAQPDAFRLFTMTFSAEAIGDSILSFLSLDLSDPDAKAIDVDCGSGVSVVPVPGAAWLLCSALLALPAIKRRFRR
jgi:hypothetical protein